MERFRRTERLLGKQRFEKLRNGFAVIVGLGAVGGYTLEALARAGVGKIRLVDFDIIQYSNINRQLLATEQTIGQAKAIAAKERILSINPDCEVEALQIFAAQESLDQIFSNSPDLVIDAIDSMNPKIQLLAGTHQRNIATFSSMGAALRTDPTLVKIGDISQTTRCPLAKRVRKMLRRHWQIETGITCVYSTEKVDFNYSMDDNEGDELDAPFQDRGRKRNTLGSLPTITGIFGLSLANLAIMHLANAETKQNP